MENELIIFDFDGVLVNTERTTFAYYQEILPTYGITLKDEDFKYKAGRKSVDFFRSIMGDRFDLELVTRLTDQKRKAFLADLKRYVIPVDGGFDLLRDCFEAGLTLALGSQNERELLERAVDEFGIRKYFTLIRSMRDLTHKKPHPEIFLGIAKQLNFNPAYSVVIEDSSDGVEAAHNGGFKIVGIGNSLDRDELDYVTLFVSTPKELNPQILKGL